MQNSQKGKRPSKQTEQSLDRLDLAFSKVPPQAKDLEAAILGAIMLEKGALDEVAGYIQAESFYVEAHQYVYTAIINLNKKARGIDVLTVTEELRTMDVLEKIGGVYFITTLTNSVVSSANIKQYAQIVQEKYLLREQIAVYSEAITKCYDVGTDVFDVLDHTTGKLTTLAMQGVKKEPRSVGAIAIERFIRLEELRHRQDGYTGIPSGFEDIDIVTGGWQNTNLIIVAARPSVGKTAFALQVARNATQNRHKPTPTLFISLEMSEGQLTDRLISCESGIELDYITRAKATDAQMQMIYQNGVQKLNQYPLFIDDTASLNIIELRAKCRKWKAKEKIGLVVIDYLQLMSGMEKKGQNREQEVSGISRGLKALAKELNIPIIALSQLNRDAENTEPTLGKLRESGAIEQDADDVIFLYREDYQKLDNEIDPALRGAANVKFAKHRNGALVKIPMNTDLSIQKWFTPLEWNTYQQNKLMPPSFTPLKVVNGDYEPDLF